MIHAPQSHRPLIAIGKSLRACNSSISAIISLTLPGLVITLIHSHLQTTRHQVPLHTRTYAYTGPILWVSSASSAATSTFFASISGRTRFSTAGARAKKAPGRIVGCSSSSVVFYSSQINHNTTSLRTRVERMPLEVPTAITFPGYRWKSKKMPTDTATERTGSGNLKLWSTV